MLYLRGRDQSREYSLDVRVCGTFFARLVGALGERRIPRDRAYLLPRCRRVHTWFMAEPIQVLHVDAAGQVLLNEPSISPFRFSRAHDDTVAVLELKPHRIPPSVTDEYPRLLLEESTARRAGLAALARGGRSG